MSRVIVGTENYSNGGYIIPTDDDTGNSVFADLEVLLERISTHSHTGADSKSISLNFTKIPEEYIITTHIIWTIVANGVYRALVTIRDTTPTFDDNLRTMYYKIGAGDWIEWNPRIERVTNTTFYVYSNDNTINLRAVYY